MISGIFCCRLHFAIKRHLSLTKYYISTSDNLLWMLKKEKSNAKAFLLYSYRQNKIHNLQISFIGLQATTYSTVNFFKVTSLDCLDFGLIFYYCPVQHISIYIYQIFIVQSIKIYMRQIFKN